MTGPGLLTARKPLVAGHLSLLPMGSTVTHMGLKGSELSLPSPGQTAHLLPTLSGFLLVRCSGVHSI